ncbi:DNA endonuclease III [Acidianus manzaensis]|uniref:DNA endonuclease III n=2 Tax=Acidianus manzaensis TaxID=282676 RepID=A0A1W6K3X6_9CREN|nr:DNA endonuclease III [Acidianus manzaensis]
MGWIVSDASSFEWWGGLKTAHEITISAFLVQMTRWESVVKVINKLREKQLNKIENLSKLSVEDLEKEIRSINFYKTKARRLKAFADKVAEEGGLENFLKIEKRPILLSMEGIGEETADSLLLFAGNNVIFPQSEYLRRVMSRVLGKKLTKSGAKQIVEEKLNKDLFEYKLFHAGIVSIGKAFCYTNNPNCDKCFLKPVCRKYNYETL